jgi:copper chaperone CopZ
MKKIILIALIGLSPLMSYAGEVNVKVNGMVCAFCTNTLEKSFKSKGEVDKVHVDLDKKNIHIVFKESQDLSDEEIKKVVTDAGYTVVEVKR